MLYLSGCVNPALPPEVGLMVTPMMGNRIPMDRTWAADTGCFAQPHRHDDDRYLDWLGNRVHLAGSCLFATAPDVVGDAKATLKRSTPMLQHIRDAGYKAALVAQDGMAPDDIPWREVDALFIGGTTDWKLGHEAAALADHARRLGLWVHMGRVNSLRRLRIAQSFGCQSADGTFAAFGPDKNIPRIQRWLKQLGEQPPLFSGGTA